MKLPFELLSFSLETEENLKAIKCFITDDDQGLHGAFKEIFKKSSFLLCCNHLWKDIIKRFRIFKLDLKQEEDLLEEIFGSNGKRENSLIGSPDEKTFEERSNIVVDKMNEFTHYGKKLGDWFHKNKLKKIYKHFCKIKWKYSELSIEYYTTNDVEGFFAKILSILKY